jgi:hypothetical protein
MCPKPVDVVFLELHVHEAYLSPFLPKGLPYVFVGGKSAQQVPSCCDGKGVRREVQK